MYANAALGEQLFKKSSFIWLYRYKPILVPKLSENSTTFGFVSILVMPQLFTQFGIMVLSVG